MEEDSRYTELKRIARGMLRGWRRGEWNTTHVAHEAWVRKLDAVMGRKNRAASFTILCRVAVRRTLVELNRERTALKRNPGCARDLSAAAAPSLPPEFDGIETDSLRRVLRDLRREREDWHDAVHLSVFGGLSSGQTGLVLGWSDEKARRASLSGLAWMRARLSAP